MLKDLILSLNNEGIKSNLLIKQGFDFLIKNSMVYSFYSIKYEIDKDDFHDWFSKKYDYEFFGSYQKKYELIGIVDRWYLYYIEHGTLADKTKSLKSDCKKWYRKNKSEDLKGFDRFFESVLRAFEEAYGTYDIVFYSVDALRKNKNFSDDRKSCFLKSRKDYFKIISQMNSFYVMVYQNKKPISRLWAVLSNDKNSIVFFNIYGYHFKDFFKFFTSSKEEFDFIRMPELQSRLGLYVNSGDWMINKNGNLDNFIYKVTCPSCGGSVYSNTLYIVRSRLHCKSCVFSSYHNRYLNEDEAIFSYALNTYIYKVESVYSYYNRDFYPEVNKTTGLKMVIAYNNDIDNFDWVTEKQYVYSSYYGYNLITEQAIYSSYYGTYLIEISKNTVFSKYLNSYVDKNDENLIYKDGDYIPKKNAEILVW